MKQNKKSIQPITFRHAGMHAMRMQYEKAVPELRDTDQVWAH